MAKFNIKNANFTLSIGGNALTCIQQVDVSGSAPQTEIECAGASAVEYVTGLPRFTLTFSGALETDDVTLLGYVNVNDAGALILKPAGTTAGDLSITSTNATVSDIQYSFPVNGFSTYSGTMVLDDLAVAANS